METESQQGVACGLGGGHLPGLCILQQFRIFASLCGVFMDWKETARRAIRICAVVVPAWKLPPSVGTAEASA